MRPLAIGGTVLWALAGLVLLVFRDDLAARGHADWLWICVAGFLLGLLGIAVMHRHDTKRRQRRGG